MWNLLPKTLENKVKFDHLKGLFERIFLVFMNETNQVVEDFLNEQLHLNKVIESQ
jgi:hypothetical protein